MRELGVRALREHLSEVLGQVQTGETILVTNNGKAVARIEPARIDAPDDVRRLVDGGRATWGGQQLEDFEPISLTPGPPVSDILLAQRDPAETVAPDDVVSGQ
jgi:prevent-host-death family protein